MRYSLRLRRMSVIVGRLGLLLACLGLPQSVFAQQFIEVQFSTTTAQAVAFQDAGAYRSVSVQVVTQGGSSTVTFQGSDDNATWVSVGLLASTAIGGTAPVVSTTGTGMFSGPLRGRYFRLNVTGIASGTTAGVVELFAQPTVDFATGGLSISSVVTGSAATQLGKAEDAAHASGDVGVLALGVRNDGGSTQTTSANGDYAQVSTDAYGVAWARSDHPNAFTCSLDAIAATLTECAAATGAGLSYYVTDIVAQSTTATAGQFLLRQGTGTNCGTGTASVWPSSATLVRFAAPGNGVAPLVVSLRSPIKLTAANALCLLGVATNTVTAQISGFIAP